MSTIGGTVSAEGNGFPWGGVLVGIVVVVVLAFIGLLMLAVVYLEALGEYQTAYILAESDYSGLPVDEFKANRPAGGTSADMPKTIYLDPWQDVLVVDSCSWEPGEAGGQWELDVAFSIFNESGGQLFANYEVRTHSGLSFGPGSDASGLALSSGDSAPHQFRTTDFPVGTKDLDLIISIDSYRDRTHHQIPLNDCAQKLEVAAYEG